MRRRRPATVCSLAWVIVIALALAGCESAPFVGTGQAATRTFDVPLSRVKRASVSALGGMRATLHEMRKTGTSEVIVGRTASRSIEIELEPLARGGTRMRVLAREGAFAYDDAMAAEIIRRVEKLLADSS